MEDKPIRILTLDAGGVKGIYSLSVLQSLEQQFDIVSANAFDYYVGSSIGGVLAAALADGITPATIASELHILVAEINNGHNYLIKRLFEWIDGAFGNKKLKDIKSNLFLPVYNHSLRKSTFFTNTGLSSELLIADALKASCSDIRITTPHLIPETGEFFSDAGFFAYDPAVFFIHSKQLEINNRLKILSIGSGIIENASLDLSASQSFDIIYDSFLEEQFRTSALVFDLLSRVYGVEYFRISEFSSRMNGVSLSALPAMANERVKSLDKARLQRFLK